MSEQKHTPGPLEIVEAKVLDNSNQWHVYLAAPDGRKIAALWGGQNEKIGNAKLFAVASELLQLVEAFVQQEVEYMTINNLGDPEQQHNVKWARATIAKAEGSKP